ncbi:hypothetical protein [Chelativorans composti]|jgi:hypothetical protein|uniref:Uncharacterized protein n=1 Tax=Chelativorans composti TaxID=768533 RepID=A0ABW5DEQ6_9HYPH
MRPIGTKLNVFVSAGHGSYPAVDLQGAFSTTAGRTFKLAIRKAVHVRSGELTAATL